jgi:hypothetical protein
MPAHDPEFDRVINEGYTVNSPTHQPEYADPSPYGIPAHPVKAGLTKRGKAAMAIGATVIAGGTLLGWQHYSAQQADAATKAQEIALKQQELKLQELKELNKAQAANQKVQSTQNAALQKQVDSCVNHNKGLVGKQLGATYRSVLEDCQAQYSATASSGDNMQNTASATNAGAGQGGVNTGFLIAGGVLVGGVAIAVRKGTRTTTA